MIVGMHNNAAREHVIEVLEAIGGVRDVDVNLHRGRAIVLHEPTCGPERLIRAVVRAGYGASAPKRMELRACPRAAWDAGRADQRGRSGQEQGESP